MEIRCHKTICKFNKKSTCMAKEISVDNAQNCQSYVVGNEPEKHNKHNHFEVGEELTEYVYCPNKKVNCDSVDCRFNKNYTCDSNGISLCKENSTAKCLSHIDK